MVEPATLHAVSPRVTGDASHVALSDLGHESLNGTSRVCEVERLLNSGPMVEVQPTRASSAVNASALLTNRVEDRAVAFDVLTDTRALGSTPRGVASLLGVALALSCLVALPCFRGVIVSAAGHMGIVPVLAADTWGNESLGTAEMAA